MRKLDRKLARELGVSPEAFRLPPLRAYWQAANRNDRDYEAEQRAKRKARDKKRKKCRCKAYPWPHRPGGGLCCWPDPPVERWQPKYEWKYRPYRGRYGGIRRQIVRASGLHPIRDRAMIDALMPYVIARCKEIKRQIPTAKYRNMKVTHAEISDGKISFGVEAQRQSAGPMM
jgi:hypothetical protein